MVLQEWMKWIYVFVVGLMSSPLLLLSFSSLQSHHHYHQHRQASSGMRPNVYFSSCSMCISFYISCSHTYIFFFILLFSFPSSLDLFSLFVHSLLFAMFSLMKILCCKAFLSDFFWSVCVYTCILCCSSPDCCRWCWASIFLLRL